MNADVYTAHTAHAADQAPCHVHTRRLEGDVYTIVFDRPESSANVFNRRALEDLDRAVDTVLAAGARGVVFLSAKPAIFVAGADIMEIKAMKRAELEAFILLGQAVFNRIEALPVTTVAAIHGACLGGGFELCLACDYRVATDAPATRIGLPETQLGILPAWGGSTRLPRLVGLPRALAAVLQGRRYTAAHAKSVGMVDEVVAREHLEQAALRHVRLPPPARPRHVLTNNPVSARFIRHRAARALAPKLRGRYPAPPAALEVMTASVGASTERSLARECEAVLALSETSQCRNLIRVFLMQERAKKATVPGAVDSAPPRTLSRTAVIGAGVMGSGIAQWISSRGSPVLLKDVDETRVAHGMQTAAGLFRAGVRRKIFTRPAARRALERITPVSGNVPLKHTDLVIEAAVENMELKKAVFRELEAAAAPDTILATNTSALSITELSESLTHPERVIGIHFFNPVSRMQLVEVVVTPHTDPAVARAAVAWVQEIGKLPVIVRDSPGFVVNRILMPYLVEAGQLFDAGVPADVVDAAMLDFGMPLGPLRLIDEVGADVALHVAETLAAGLAPRFSVPDVLRRMVAAGYMGKKSDAGFYRYRNGHAEGRNQGLAAAKARRTFREEEIVTRLVMTMINEAACCLAEGVVAEPERVDFAMIMGTGFAPFRGGPLRYADTLGLSHCADTLARLSGTEGARYAPCALVVEMAKNRRCFYEPEGGQQ